MIIASQITTIIVLENYIRNQTYANVCGTVLINSMINLSSPDWLYITIPLIFTLIEIYFMRSIVSQSDWLLAADDCYHDFDFDTYFGALEILEQAIKEELIRTEPSFAGDLEEIYAMLADGSFDKELCLQPFKTAIHKIKQLITCFFIPTIERRRNAFS